ncbi:SGNH/GDSL hydrolase family protein [Gordonia iterans]
MIQHRSVRSVLVRLAAAAAVAVPAVVLVPSAAAMPDPAPRGAQYVSLGDSYVAAGDMGNGTNPSAGCAQAPDNVGHLVARRMPGVSFADWSCSGADTDDITKVTDKGPQIRGLSEKAQYVSLSIGGNDDGIFGDLIKQCVVGALCPAGAEKDAMPKIDKLEPRLDRTYAAVRAAAPNAQVAVIPYLKILPDDPRGCFVDAVMGAPAVKSANRVQKRLNATITEAATRAGFTVVDPNTLPGRDMCGPDGKRFLSFTGMLPGENGTPIHPTLAGRKHTAKLVAAAFTR